MNFDDHELDSSAATDAAVDVDTGTLTIPIEMGPHHMGDTAGGTPDAPEGSTWSGGFDLSIACSSATFEVDFYAPWGPLPDSQAPVFAMNGTALPSITPFFVNCNAMGCDDFTNGPVHVSLPTSAVVGANVLTLASPEPTDDYFWGSAELRCQR